MPAHPHTYDTVIQAGTLLPVFAYFRHDWARLAGAAVRMLRRRRLGEDPCERLALFLGLGTLPALVAGALLHSRVEVLGDPEANPIALLVIGLSLVIVALAMWLAEVLSGSGREEADLRQSDAWTVGLAQAVAIIPGVSRSGATITAGIFAGLSRPAAARFSFLLMAPVMVAATAFGGLKLWQSPEPVSPAEWQSLALGALVAAVVGYAAIAWLLRFLRRNALYPFVVYRCILGGYLIALYLLGGR